MARLHPLIIALATVMTLAVARPGFAADIDPSWIGGWIGELTPVDQAQQKPDARARLLPTALVVRKGADGAPMVTISSIAMGALDKGGSDASAEGKSLRFALPIARRQGRFEATVSDDGKTAVGSLTMESKDAAEAPKHLRWQLRRVDLVSEVATARVYRAELDAMGQKLPMQLSLGEGPHGWCGSIDITVQGISGFMLDVSRGAEGAFRIVMQVGVPATMELKADDGMKVLEGTFSQGAFSGPIRFEVVEGAQAGAVRRPQDPAADAPYRSIEVRVPHPAGHELAGTLSMPAEKRLARDGRVPAVVLISGSGPQNRDEELMGHRPFAVIADALARAGIAVLRYDDRGFGASTGSFESATTIDFASDADVASEWLKKRDGIDPDRVGLVGHSEGAMIAPIVAAWQNAGDAPLHPIAFTVLLAPPAESGGATVVRQTARMYEVVGLDKDGIEKASRAQEALLAAVVADGRDAGELARLAETLVRSQFALSGGSSATDQQVRGLTESALKQLDSPWMRVFIALDPAGALARTEVPTLAMWGAKDVQVVPGPNRALLESIAARAGARFDMRVLDGLNHLFQPATTGLPDEYGAIEITFDPAALAQMVEWISAKAGSLPSKQVPESSRPTGWDSAPIPARPPARNAAEATGG